MSERMIELQRARLLAAKGSKSGSAQPGALQNGPQSAQLLLSAQASTNQQTPRQAAASAMQTEDAQLRIFLQKLQRHRDDSRPGDSWDGPTVPTALSRRMLQRQGAGYFDSTVAAIASAAADRFLATVLQQAVACRDQRLKGAEMAREAAKQRKRHKRQYEEDTDDRKRRKEEKDAQREEANLAAIQAAEDMKNNRGTASSTAKSKEESPGNESKSKKKKKDSQPNGLKRKTKETFSDDEVSYDSIDDEEEYYRNHYDGDDFETDEEEEDDETMILRDLARPLEAWDFCLDGKLGMHRKRVGDHDDDAHSDEQTDEQTEMPNQKALADPMDIDNSDEEHGDKKVAAPIAKGGNANEKNGSLQKASVTLGTGNKELS
jgi:hypothetical protein